MGQDLRKRAVFPIMECLVGSWFSQDISVGWKAVFRGMAGEGTAGQFDESGGYGLTRGGC